MSPVCSRLIGLGLALALAALPFPLRSPASDAQEEVDLTISDGGGSFTNSVGMKLVRVRAGKFLMGAPNGEVGAGSGEQPRHEVTLTKDFYLGVHEVTQKQFQTITGRNPSRFCKDGSGQAMVQNLDTSNFPVESVSWDEAIDFCKRLSDRAAEKSAGRAYRLPTEAEWECACRGGHKIGELGEKAAALQFHLAKPTASFGQGDGNFDSEYPYGTGQKGQGLKRPCPVGSYKPNVLGLYDMHGNIREWCSDWYEDGIYQQKNRRDPTGPQNGSARSTRGGSWRAFGDQCRAAQRVSQPPNRREEFVGFRVAVMAR